MDRPRRAAGRTRRVSERPSDTTRDCRLDALTVGVAGDWGWDDRWRYWPPSAGTTDRPARADGTRAGRDRGGSNRLSGLTGVVGGGVGVDADWRARSGASCRCSGSVAVGLRPGTSWASSGCGYRSCCPRRYHERRRVVGGREGLRRPMLASRRRENVRVGMADQIGRLRAMDYELETICWCPSHHLKFQHREMHNSTQGEMES